MGFALQGEMRSSGTGANRVSLFLPPGGNRAFAADHENQTNIIRRAARPRKRTLRFFIFEMSEPSGIARTLTRPKFSREVGRNGINSRSRVSHQIL